MEHFTERCIRCGLETLVLVAEGSTFDNPVFICDDCQDDLDAENARLDHIKAEVD